jgi:hypothetical protein
MLSQEQPMQDNAARNGASKGAFWTGWVLSILPSLFLLMGGTMSLMKPPQAVEGTVKMGFSENVMTPLGITVIVCTVLYLFPKTSVLGAILLTGYLGGAVATHVRVGDPMFGKTLVPVYFGIVIWLGLVLRCPRLRALVPLRS